LEDKFYVALLTGNKANAYFKKGEYDKAIEFLLIDFEVSKQFNQWESAANAVALLGSVYLKKGDLTKTKYYLDTALQLMESRSFINYRPNLYRTYTDYFRQIQDYKSASEYDLLYHTYQDSVSKIVKERELNQLKSQFDFVRTLSEIELLRKNNQIQQEQYKQTILLTFSVVVISLLLIVLGLTLYFNLRQVKRINHQLESMVNERTEDLQQKNEALDKYLYRASHDIRRPIASILGLTQVLQMKCDDEGTKDLIDKVKYTAEQMDNMLHKIHYLYMLDKFEEPEEFFVSEVLNDLIKEFETLTEVHGIDVRLNINDEVKLRSIIELLRNALRCMMENACYYRSPLTQKHLVSIEAKRVGQWCEISITDNGIGMTEDYIERIKTQEQFRGEKSNGNGLGVYIANKCVEKLQGHLTFVSQIASGTTVTIAIPIDISDAKN
jgi:signal transduction histidine kinase